MQASSLARFFRTLLVCSLLTTGLLVVGCDSSGSMDNGDNGDDMDDGGDDTEAPAAPSGLTGDAGESAVELSWDAVGADDLSGYNVYRSTSSIDDVSGMDPINGSLESSTSYTDDEVESGTEYFYVVTAVDDSDNESDPSDEISAMPGDTTAPNAPSGLTADAGDGMVDLTWDAVSADDLSGYNLYRSTSSIDDVSGMDPINGSPLSETSYTDDGVENDTEYFYVATAVDESDNESDVSNEVSATPSGDGSIDGSNLKGLFRPAVSAADIDGDGDKDLLAVGEPEGSQRSTILYEQQSDGSFQEVSAGLQDMRRASTSIADVDGDGNQDLLIAGSTGPFEKTATLYLGDGTGGFQTADADLKGVQFSATAIADVDGDGNKDLLIAGEDASGDLSTTLYLQQSDGNFQPANAGLRGFSQAGVSIADFTGDGTKDIVLAGDAPGSTTILYEQQSDGSFEEANAGLQDAQSAATSAADVDGDGDQDLLIAGSSGGTPNANLYKQEGGSLQNAGEDLTGALSAATSIGDANGDDALDLLITGDVSGTGGEPNTALYNQQSDGSFAETDTDLPDIENGAVLIEDLDMDGDTEVVIGGETDASDHTLTIFEMF